MEGILSQKEIDALLGVGGDEAAETEEQVVPQNTKKILFLLKKR